MNQLISVQSRGNRMGSVAQRKFASRITGKLIKKYQVRLKQFKWQAGFFGPHIQSMSETNERTAFELVTQWLAGATV